MKWHLNIEDSFFHISVNGKVSKEKVTFGVKKHNGEKIILGEIDLDFPHLLLKKRIAFKDQKYQVNIYYERPTFFISLTRDNRNRLDLDVQYPILTKP